MTSIYSQREDKPWGREEIWAKTDNYVGKILVIQPGNRLSLQYHKNKEESILVLSGKVNVTLMEQKKVAEPIKFTAKSGSVVHISPELIHRLSTPEDSSATLIEISTPEINDIVRIEDDFGRADF